MNIHSCKYLTDKMLVRIQAALTHRLTTMADNYFSKDNLDITVLRADDWQDSNKLHYDYKTLCMESDSYFLWVEKDSTPFGTKLIELGLAKDLDGEEAIKSFVASINEGLFPDCEEDETIDDPVTLIYPNDGKAIVVVMWQGLCFFLLLSEAVCNDMLSLAAEFDVTGSKVLPPRLGKEANQVLTVQIGSTHLTTDEFAALQRGSTLKLQEQINQEVSIYDGNKNLVAQGELVAIDDFYGVTLTEVRG